MARVRAAFADPGSTGRALSKVGAYVALTKPRIIELLLITTVPAMVVAADGWPGTRLVIATVVGGTLAAGGANATNMVIDRDIDRVMERTRGRPLATGAVSPTGALTFAVALQVVAFVLLWAEVNLLSAGLAIGAGLFYIFVYSLWLKRSHESNIVIGGAAGAIPPVVGWTAVTGQVTVPALLLFVLVFVWTPPHFWALAIRYADDYSAAEVPMLPSVASLEVTTRKIRDYAVVVWAVAVAFGPVAGLGWIYTATAVVAGAVFAWQARALRLEATTTTARAQATTQRAMRTFAHSITMLTAVFLAMAVDVWVRSGW